MNAWIIENIIIIHLPLFDSEHPLIFNFDFLNKILGDVNKQQKSKFPKITQLSAINLKTGNK